MGEHLLKECWKFIEDVWITIHYSVKKRCPFPFIFGIHISPVLNKKTAYIFKFWNKTKEKDSINRLMLVDC